MATLHEEQGGSREPAGLGAVWACLGLLLVLGWPAITSAQPASSAAMLADAHIMIHSSVARATPWAEPAPDTPVPAWAEQSYKAYLQMKAQAHGGTIYTRTASDRMPDWSGIWATGPGIFTWDALAVPAVARRIGPQAAENFLTHCWRGNTAEFPCKGWMLAALTPRFALKYRQKLEAVAHNVEWDPLSDCLPQGFPRTMIGPFGKEFIATPKETWITAVPLNDMRRIYTDGRGHVPPDEAYPLWNGDSIGFWDGDTLVVHTLYLRSGEMQRVQPALSTEASVVERIKMIDPNTLQDDATIYDPLALRKPWHGVHTYRRLTADHVRMDMYSCDPDVYQTPEGATGILIPGQSVTIKREYRDPTEDQNYGLQKVYRYGAKLLRGAAPKAAAKDGSR